MEDETALREKVRFRGRSLARGYPTTTPNLLPKAPAGGEGRGERSKNEPKIGTAPPKPASAHRIPGCRACSDPGRTGGPGFPAMWVHPSPEYTLDPGMRPRYTRIAGGFVRVPVAALHVALAGVGGDRCRLGRLDCTGEADNNKNSRTARTKEKCDCLTTSWVDGPGSAHTMTLVP